MNDLALAVAWLSVLAGGIGSCLLLHRLGVPTTHVRDLLHIGTGVWVLGWPWWNGAIAPALILGLALAATVSLPVLAGRSRWAGLIVDSLASGDERWSGLSLYVTAYALLSSVGLVGRAFPAAAGLLALSLGDGIGGAVGRRFGTHRYRIAGGKDKTLEGSATVALAAAAGVAVAGWRFGVHPGAARIAGLGIVAAVSEALAPRGSDNMVVPVAVWGAASLFA